MILSVAEKLDFESNTNSREYAQFKETISESIENLIAKSS